MTTQNEDILETKKPRTLGPEYQPGQVIEYNVSDVANNFLNNTGYDIESLVFDLKTLSYSNPDSTPVFENELVQWGDVNGDGKIGYSNNPDLKDIFTDVSIKDNIITFSGGIIPNETLFYNPFATTPMYRQVLESFHQCQQSKRIKMGRSEWLVITLLFLNQLMF
ncbi:hypothetical protein [Nostoc sp.]|uniref:hypothetical protein n=1 Tax=Nostoc sp. TaxID=1180 RepID=UPI002FF4E0D8